VSVAVTETPQYQHRNRMVSNFQLHSEVGSMKRSCSSRNKHPGFGAASPHRRRSHGRSTLPESIQSLAPQGLAAKANAAWIAPLQCPCAHVAHLLSEVLDIDRIPIPQQVTWELVKGKGLSQLLPRPFRGRMTSHVEGAMRRRS